MKEQRILPMRIIPVLLEHPILTAVAPGVAKRVRKHPVIRRVLRLEPYPFDPDAEEIPQPLLEFQEKWLRHTLAARRRWVEAVKTVAYPEYVEGISAITGIPPEVVRRSLPAEEYRRFAEAPERYVPIWIEGVKRAAREHRWAEEYMEAFYRPAEAPEVFR